MSEPSGQPDGAPPEPSSYSTFLRVFGRTPDEVTRLLFRQAMRLCNRRAAEAEDLTQETMLRLVKFAKGGSPLALTAIPTFLRTVLVNCWRERHREQNAVIRGEGHQPLVLDERVDVVARQPGPERLALSAETARELRAAVDRLSPSLREVFLLKVDPWAGDFLRHSNHEIAEILDIPIGTVKSRFNAATANIRESLRTLLTNPEGITHV